MSDGSRTHGGILIMAVAVVVSAIVFGGAIPNIPRGNDTITFSQRSGMRCGERYAKIAFLRQTYYL